MNRTSIFLFLISYFLFFSSSCTINKAKINNDLKRYFDAQGVDGCFTILDNATGEIVVYNMKYDTMRFLPASTFKVVNSLIGLETGKIVDENMVIKWDGVQRSRPEWNRDMGMKEAFKVSNVPYYQEVARRIGRDTLQFWLDTLSYGNRKIEGPVDSFWLNNSLKVSPDEQLGFMKRLYFDQLPFRKSVHQSVKDAMLQEDNTAYRLSYKTGWGYDESKKPVGWVTGWIEENRHVYFFVTLVLAQDPEIDMPKVRMSITKDILKDLGFFEGKR